MSMIDIERLLQPVTADEPCGEDLSELTEYYVLEDLVTGGEPEGDSIAAEPEWSKALSAACDLLERGKELRVAVHLLHALVRTDGFPGLRDGLQVLAGLLEEFWGSLYPLLEEDYDAPSEARMNILRELSSGAMGAETISPVVRAVREAPVSSSRQLGAFCWRDILITTGELPPPSDDTAPQAALVEGAIRDTEEDTLQALLAAIEQSIALTDRIDAFLTEQVGTENTCQITKLGQLLTLILRHLRHSLSGDTADVEAAAAEAGGSVVPSPARGFSGSIGSQGDVLKALDAICEWYDKNERSSPVPLLLKRAKRLVGQDFMTIVNDIAQNAEDQVRDLVGIEEEDG